MEQTNMHPGHPLKPHCLSQSSHEYKWLNASRESPKAISGKWTLLSFIWKQGQEKSNMVGTGTGWDPPLALESKNYWQFPQAQPHPFFSLALHSLIELFVFTAHFFFLRSQFVLLIFVYLLVAGPKLFTYHVLNKCYITKYKNYCNLIYL